MAAAAACVSSFLNCTICLPSTKYNIKHLFLLLAFSKTYSYDVHINFMRFFHRTIVISIPLFLKGRHHHFSALMGLAHVYVNDGKCVHIHAHNICIDYSIIFFLKIV